MERLRALWRDQSGISLAELAVAMGLMGIVATMYITSVLNVQKAVTETEVRSQGNDAVRSALQAIDRELRSGNLVYDPTTESPPGHSGFILRIETQSNGTTLAADTKCVRWRVLGGKLERQSYKVVAGNASVITGWRTLAEDIVNRDVAPAVPAFTLSEDRRTVSIVLLANAKLSNPASRTIQSQTSVAIRNSTPATNPCSPTPTW